MTPDDPKSQYDALYEEYQNVMHQGAWRIGWGFFFVLVGLLPIMYIFIWMAGPRTWERTLFHEPTIMWLAAPLNFGIVVVLLLRLYRKNLELDTIKQNYLARLRELKSQAPQEEVHTPNPAPERDWDTFQDDSLS